MLETYKQDVCIASRYANSKGNHMPLISRTLRTFQINGSNPSMRAAMDSPSHGQLLQLPLVHRPVRPQLVGMLLVAAL